MGEDFDGEGDIVGGAAARKVRDERVETLEKGAGDGKSADLLESFVEEVAGVEVGSDEDIGAASDGGIGEFVMGDVGV